MHLTQKKIIEVISEQTGAGKLSLRKMADLIEVSGKPQIVKHHLTQLVKKGFLRFTEAGYQLVKNESGKSTSSLIAIPIVGATNYGSPTIFAKENIEKYLRVSSKLLPKKKKLFGLVANGVSMNKSLVNGKNIENGDFVIVDSEAKNFKNEDIVVAIIDGMATAKKIIKEKAKKRIVLLSESTDDFLPIYLDESDDFIINGKVVDVIKR